MAPVKIGFVGAGRMGQIAHLRNYAEIDVCEVVALAEPREHLAERVADRYEIPTVYPDHTALIEDADVDALVAAQPYRRHTFIVPDLLEASVPLFTEKPLAVSVEAGEELADLADDHGVAHMVGYHKRSDPAMEHAKSVIDEWTASGEYGPMRYVRVTMPPGNWVANAPTPVRTEEEPPDGELEAVPDSIPDDLEDTYDYFINYYIHQVNALRFCFGEAYSVAYADPGKTLMVAESERGVTGTIEMELYETTNGWDESVLIGFEHGYVKVSLPPPLISQRAGTVEIMQDDGDGEVVTRPSMPPTSAMRAQAENFLGVVRGERAPPCDSREAVEDLQIARQYVEALVGE